MKHATVRALILLTLLPLGLVLPAATVAQEAPSGHGTRSGMGGGMGMMATGLMGTVTTTATDHFQIKTYLGESYLVHFSANTHFMKMPSGEERHHGDALRRGDESASSDEGQQQSRMDDHAIPELTATDIKTGDSIGVMGSIDAAKHEAGAVYIVLVSPERAHAMKESMAGFGKTWLIGKVTSIDGTKLIVQSQIDNRPHTVVANENTALRKRREPVTLVDIHPGDTLRAEGSVQDGTFTATSINVMTMPMGGEGRMPRQEPPRSDTPEQ
jgi:hypothetical protein